MKFGILCNFYGFPHYLDEVLKGWLNVEDCVFAAASCKFDEYIKIDYINEDTETIRILNSKYSNLFKYIYSDSISNDSTVRNYPLEYLLSQDVDYIWLLDEDEFYSKQEIEKIKKFVQLEQFIPFFKINFKNYFNDTNHWVDGFCPPRIFKVKTNKLNLSRFYFENDILYKDKDDNDIDYKSLSYIEIPKCIAHIKHYSWCGDKNFLKSKIKYQNTRYNGICSYSWNEEKNELQLNDSFYKKYNIEKPNIYEDTHIYNN